MVTVPNLSGKTVTQAASSLSAVGLYNGTISFMIGAYTPPAYHTVVLQSPSPGSSVAPGTAVDVTVHEQNQSGADSDAVIWGS